MIRGVAGSQRGLPRLLVAGSMMLSAVAAAAPTPPAVESCEAIRAKIGRLPASDGDLLRSLAERQEECRFTPAEVYRAAHGDKPMAAFHPIRRPEAEEDDDD